MGILIDLVAYRRARAAPLWRSMSVDDIRAVATLAVALDPKGDLSEGTLKACLASSPGTCLVMEASGSVAGYAVGRTEIRNGLAVLMVDDLALRPDLRDKGHGSTAIGLLAVHAAASGACAMATVARQGSDGFWSRQRFLPTGSVPGRPDGQVMARAVPRAPPLQVTYQGACKPA